MFFGPVYRSPGESILIWRTMAFAPPLRDHQPLKIGAVSCVLIAAGLIGSVASTGPVSAIFLSSLPLILIFALLVIASLGSLASYLLDWHWWQTVWFSLWASGIVLRVRGTSGITNNPLDAAALYRLALVGVAAGILVWGTISNNPNMFRAARSPLFLALLLFNIVNLCSSMWSIYPTWTIYRSVELLIDTLVIVAITSSFKSLSDIKGLFDWTWILFGSLLLAVVVNLILVPDRAIFPMRSIWGFGIEGVYPVVSRNGIGQISGTLLAVFITRLACGAPHKGALTMLAAACTTLLILSQTRSAIIPVVLVIPIILILAKRYGSLLLGILIVFPVLFVTALPTLLDSYLSRGQADSELMSLSGRTEWWQVALGMWRQRPIIGFGAFTGGRFIVGAKESDTLSSSHNTWVEVLVGTGILGIAPLIILLLGTWILIAKTLPPVDESKDHGRLARMLAIESIAVLFIITIRSMMSVTMIWHPSLEFLIVVAYATFAAQQQTSERGKPIMRASPASHLGALDAHPSRP